jgi:Uma2 family endonuclease
MVATERMTGQAFERFALDDPERRWELHDGVPREKPGMTWDHNWDAAKLGNLLMNQLDWSEFQVRFNAGHVRRTDERYYIPDVMVVPVAYGAPFRDRPDRLEVFDQPLPLVIEVWSRSTGDYDVDEKLAEHQSRGDREIWLLHPFERTLTRWLRQDDDSCVKEVVTGGVVRPAFLPNVVIDLEAVFDA